MTAVTFPWGGTDTEGAVFCNRQLLKKRGRAVARTGRVVESAGQEASSVPSCRTEEGSMTC